MARDRRRLMPEEEALWQVVKKSAKPLHGLMPEAVLAPPVPEAAPVIPADIAAATAPMAQKLKGPPPLPSLHPLGRRERQRVVKGALDIEGRIDLHGLRQNEAHARLAGFLAVSQAHGHRLVLVITGKGSPTGFESLHGPERGVLRRLVPLWLSLPEFRSQVAGFEEAHITHGGAGALYVRIRKRK
jgi:DNA-nicking Smr family endonuclease